jgi:competence protein ComEC
VAKSKVFLWLSLGFIGGVFWRSFGNFNFFWQYGLAISAVIILVIFWKNPKAALAAFFIAFFICGVGLTESRLKKLENLNLDKKEFSGRVKIIREPEIKDQYQNLVVETLEKNKFLVNIYGFSQYAYGDELEIKCLLGIPENKSFDYRMYLAKEGIFYLCQKAKIAVAAHDQGNKFYAVILKIKSRLQRNIDKAIPAPQSGLLSGLLLGGDDKLSQEIQNNFSKTGMTHIVAVSGYNVTIIAEYLMLLGIFLGLWRKQAFWFALVGIFLFVVMTGFPASAVRAGVMGSLILWAMKNGRLSNAQNSVIFSAGAMLLFNPLLLRWDVGFQLSFGATIGIIYFYPLIEKYSIKKNGLSFLSEILFLTLSAQVFVLPVILNDFQKLSVISPLANLLVLPIIPLTMLLGFIMAVLAFVFPPLATVFAWLTFLPLKYETSVINFLANLKFSSLEVMNFSWVWVAGWYIILAGLVISSKRTRKNRNNPNMLKESLLKKN